MTTSGRTYRALGQSRAASLVAAVAAFAMVALAGVASAESRETLGEGDVIHVTVFQNPDLTTETRISERGTITFPMVGEVQLAGLTPALAESAIAKKLEQGKFVLKPQVSVNVTKVRSRQVSVLGQVAKPGRYPLDEPSTSIADLIATAGGITNTGDDNVTVVLRRGGQSRRVDVNVNDMYRTGDLTPNVELQNGDTIYVQRAPVFYIYGEVQRAGAYRLEPSMTVVQAIAVGGGITTRGTERGLKVKRKGPDGSVRTIDATPGDKLVADDVVYVQESLF